jgi:hypothetical protein
MKVIADGICLEHLDFLLEFLAAWEKRPVYLTPMAYQWCSAISEAAGRLGVGEPPDGLLSEQQLQSLSNQPGHRIGSRLRLRHRPRDLSRLDVSAIAEGGFSAVGPGCNPVRIDNTSHHTHIYPQDLIPFHYVRLLPMILEIGFRLAGLGHGMSDPYPFNRESDLHAFNRGSALHTFHREWTFKGAFSSDDDESLADAATVWIICGDYPPPGSFVCYFAKRIERSKPISPRLRQVAIRVIEQFWRSELDASGSEIIRSLNRLDVDVDDMVGKDPWAQLLVGVVRLPAGPESLSSHYWRLFDKLAPKVQYYVKFIPRDAEVMRLLEEAGDWERLEDWTVVVWLSSPGYYFGEDVEQATLRLLLRRPSALARLENLYRSGQFFFRGKNELRQICDQARAEQPPSESPPPLYVSVRPAPRLPVLTPPFKLFVPVNRFTPNRLFPFLLRETTLSAENIYVVG